MMPGMDGQDALREIRIQEEKSGVQYAEGPKNVMTTTLDDTKSVFYAFHELCDSYLTKPLRKETLLEELRKLKLIQ